MKNYQIQAVSAFEDNYIWLIHNDTQAIIIDPGSSQEVLDYLNRHQLIASAILVTHHHDDHTGGVRKILNVYKDCALYAHKEHGFKELSFVNLVDEGDEFGVIGLTFKVWRTAGHTDSHLSYVADIDQKTHVFCGDTLFSAGCGRVFTGTMAQLFESMRRFNEMDDGVVFYPAHEYTLSNLKFAQSVATDDAQPMIDQATQAVKTLRQAGKMSLPVTLEHERKINVFLQACDAQKAKEFAAKHHLAQDTALSVFTWLREKKNNF